MARTFNGSSSNYLEASGLLYNPGTNCTWVFRAKTSANSADMGILGRRLTNGWMIRRNAANNSLQLVTFTSSTIESSVNSWPADGAYHNFIITKSGTSFTIYIDGTSVGTGTATITSEGTGNLFVGAWNNVGFGAADPFNGSIYDVAIFPDVLGSTDRASFNGGAAPSALTAAGTDHYWTLNNAAATGETDDFGSADLTEVGTVGYEANPGAAPSFSSSPSNQTVTQPATATFSATYSGTITGHQWQVSTDGGTSWGSVPDGTGASGGAGTGATLSYTTTATAVSTGNHRNGYRYRCRLTHSGGTVDSSAGILTVNAPPLSVTLDALVDESGNPRAAYTVDKVLAIRLSDNTVVAVKTNQTTNGSGVLPAFSDGALTAAPHLFVTWDDNETPNNAGAKVYTPS